MAPRRHPISEAALRRWPLPRPDDTAGKEDRGQVLIIGGSRELPGTMRLCGEAALRGGAGKLQIATVRSAAVQLGVMLPEARIIALPESSDGTLGSRWSALQPLALRADAVLVGPGTVATTAMRRLVRQLMSHIDAPMVIDAGALTSVLAAKPGGATLITPHAGEMAALLDIEREAVEAEPVAIAHAFAEKHALIVVLKAKTTVIADGVEVWTQAQGVPGLGTSGSGDVLSGLLSGLLARGAHPVQAAAWAVYLHARAGKELASEIGTVGFLARELSALFPKLLAKMESRKT
jgi:ADP-dependent NAD(P)H-hydrate dehydratase